MSRFKDYIADVSAHDFLVVDFALLDLTALDFRHWGVILSYVLARSNKELSNIQISGARRYDFRLSGIVYAGIKQSSAEQKSAFWAMSLPAATPITYDFKV